MFWTVSFLCLSASFCSLPEPAYNPAFSFYVTEEACKRRISIADKIPGGEMRCVSSDTITFSSSSGFSANASIMVHPH